MNATQAKHFEETNAAQAKAMRILETMQLAQAKLGRAPVAVTHRMNFFNAEIMRLGILAARIVTGK